MLKRLTDGRQRGFCCHGVCNVQSGIRWLDRGSCLLILLFLCSSGIRSDVRLDTMMFEHLGMEEGLSQGYVTSILQDSRGFMWFGTADGLNRFDGYEFEVFRYDPFDPYSLSSNSIQSIIEDRSGHLWVGTENGGLNRFDPRTGRFTRFRHDPQNPSSLSNDMVFGIYESPGEPGVLWIGTNRGLNKLVLTGEEAEDPEGVTFLHYLCDSEDPDNLLSCCIRSVIGDGTGRLWVGTLHGLVLLDPMSLAVVRYSFDPEDPASLSDNNVIFILKNSSGQLWISTFKGGLNRFDAEKEVFVRYRHDASDPASLGSDSTGVILEDSSGGIWIGTDNGLDRLDLETGTFIHYRHDPASPSTLSHSGIVTLYQSSSGIIWVGTNTGGINRFSPQDKAFVHIHKNSQSPPSLENNSVYAFSESRLDPGIVWIGTGGGLLHRFNRVGQTMRHYAVYGPDHPSRSSIYVRAIEGGGPSGSLWVACTDGLKRFDPKKEEFFHYRHDPDDPSRMSEVPHIVALFADPETPGALWVGYNDSGLSRFDIQSERFEYFTHDAMDDDSLSSSAITSIAKSHGGFLWIGTKNGLNHFDTHTHRARRFFYSPDQPNSLSSNSIKSIFEDRGHTVWVGTDGGGLNKLVWENQGELGTDRPEVTLYLEEDGLASSVVYAILPDDLGHLWLSTNGGLSRFHPQTETFRSFDSSAGLQSNEFNTGAFLKTSDGALFFGGVNGLNVLHPEEITDNPHIPPIVFRDFQLFNESVTHGADSPLDDPILVATEVLLEHDQNVFSFEFAALDYSEPENNLYAYKLEGLDDSWNQIGTRRFITFTSLPAGEYTLRVKGSNNDNVWNEEGASIRIRITPPWWKTLWAYVLYVSVGLGVLFAGLRLQLHRERMKSQLQLQRMKAKSWHELDQMKSRFFANISHEFRTPLTLILGPMKKLLESGAEGGARRAAEMVLRNAEQLLGMVNELLELSKLEAGKLELRAGLHDLNHLVKGILFAFESHAETRGIALCFSSDSDISNLCYDPDKMEKIFKNLLSNAIKFTPDGGEVRVEVQTTTAADKEGDREGLVIDGAPIPHLQVSVWNSGAGIDEEHLPFVFNRFYQAALTAGKEHGSGIGLALTKELVELHHGSVSASSRAGEWAQFTLRLPLGTDWLTPEERVADSPGEESDMAFVPQAIGKESPCEESAPAATDAETLVLIVEDNSDMRTYIAEALADSATITQAADGVQGFEEATERIPTLIISDVMMPEMDGYELCRRLKTDERTSHIPVILLTAKSGLESKVEGLQLGADDYLVKPFDSAELKVRVDNLIGQRRQLRERFSREIKLQPADIAITPADEIFLNRLIASIETRLDDPDLSVEWLAAEIYLSRSQLHRKLHALVDQSASAFIRSLRLQRAVRLLEEKAATISEIAYRVGFSSPAYFRKCFKERFGVSPSEYGS